MGKPDRAGKGNQLRLSLYGSEGGVEWDQEQPNQLRYTRVGSAAVIIERGGAGSYGGYTTRLPAHHPEGYLEAFAQLYSDAADLIAARDGRTAPTGPAAVLPGIEDGIEGIRFVAAAVASSRATAWLAWEDWP